MTMNKKLREMLEELSPVLIIYGIIFVALSGDAYTNSDMNFGEYIVLALKLFIPGFIGIFIKILLYLSKKSSKTKTVVVHSPEKKETFEDSDKRFSEIMNALDSVNKK